MKKHIETIRKVNMEKKDDAFNDLHLVSREARVLGGISHLLDWDQETYMPAGASEIRAEQLKVIAGLIHQIKTGKKFSDSLSKLIDIKTGKVLVRGLAANKTAALKEWRKEYIKAKALPKFFVEDYAQMSSQAILVWRSAKQNNSFKTFSPYLEKLINMARKKADYLGYKDHPYDALIDEYEPETPSKEIEVVFTSLKKSIVALLKKIGKVKQIDDSPIHGNFPHDKQIEFANRILHDMGYDKHHGRLDFSSHPFSSAPHPTDSRITTRFHPTSLMSCISVILHEAGHALYEMGLPPEHYGNPLGDFVSLGIHESQSRWWETRIGQSKPFWNHYLPILQKQFGGKLNKVDIDQFYRMINKVEPSLIRVEADEVTYSLHVILRFEMEKALIEGSLKVSDIPEMWNSKMKELLGLTPVDDREGCLQDIHWAMGAYGYFPTYSLGNLYASHFFEAFAKKHTDWEKRVARGDLLFIKEWLNENIHAHGKHYTSLELLKKVTGKPFSADAFTTYLNKKYGAIYSSP